MDAPQPTLEDLQAQIAELREKVDAIEGALNALVVVYGVRRLPEPRPGQAPADSEPPA